CVPFPSHYSRRGVEGGVEGRRRPRLPGGVCAPLGPPRSRPQAGPTRSHSRPATRLGDSVHSPDVRAVSARATYNEGIVRRTSRSRTVTSGFDLTGRVALITGGSKGLGKAMARGLAEAGADIVIASRHEDELQFALGEILEGTD